MTHPGDRGILAAVREGVYIRSSQARPELCWCCVMQLGDAACAADLCAFWGAAPHLTNPATLCWNWGDASPYKVLNPIDLFPLYCPEGKKTWFIEVKYKLSLIVLVSVAQVSMVQQYLSKLAAGFHERRELLSDLTHLVCWGTPQPSVCPRAQHGRRVPVALGCPTATRVRQLFQKHVHTSLSNYGTTD